MKTTIRQRAIHAASRIGGGPMAQATATDIIELVLRRERAIMARSRLVRLAAYEAMVDDRGAVDLDAWSRSKGGE